MKRRLTKENFNKGFLIDDEVIGGVTVMEPTKGWEHASMHSPAPQIYSAYVSHYLTGETYVYREFNALEPALEFLASIDRAWIYEAIGCAKKTATNSSSGGCGSGDCGSGCATGCK